MDAGLNLFRMELFVAVVERGGFSAAGAHLDLSQPTVSFHIKTLERILGAKLILYRGRAIELTPEGEEVYRAAKAIVRDAEHLIAGVRELHEGQRGRLRVGASISLEQAFFFDRIIAPFSRAHPRVQLSLRFGHSVRLAEAVLGRELDLAYGLNWRLPEGVEYEALHEAEFAFFASPQHPLASRTSISAVEADRAGLIAAPESGADVAAYASMFRRAGVTRYHIALEVDGVQARMLAAEAGLGVLTTFLPAYAGENPLPRLCRLRLEGEPTVVQFGLLSRVGEVWTPAMREFAALVRKVSE